MSLIVKLLAVVLLLALLRMLLMKFFGPPPQAKSGSRSTGAKPISGQMVKDPQCGMYIATNIAIPARAAGETYFFCSDDCKSAFLKSQKPSH